MLTGCRRRKKGSTPIYYLSKAKAVAASEAEALAVTVGGLSLAISTKPAVCDEESGVLAIKGSVFSPPSILMMAR